MIYKNFEITTNAGYSLTKVSHVGSGKMPAFLDGWYTNPKEAMAGIDMYLNSRKKVVLKDGKKNSGTAE